MPTSIKDQLIEHISNEILHREDRPSMGIQTLSRIFVYIEDIPEAIGFRALQSGIETIMEMIGCVFTYINVEPEVRMGEGQPRNASITIGLDESGMKVVREASPAVERSVPVPTKDEEQALRKPVTTTLPPVAEKRKEITSDIAAAGDFFGD